MKIRIILLMISAFIFGAAFTSDAKAEGMLFVSPTRIYLNENKKVETVNVSNVTSSPSTYKVSLEDLIMTEAGGTIASTNSPYSAKKMLRFFPREFTVQPGEHQTIRLMAKIPADLPDGEYHAHIKFFQDVEKPKELPAPTGEISKARVHAAFSYSTLLPITVSKGKIETKIGWISPKIEAVPGKPKTYKLTTQLTREGNGQGNSYMDIMYVEGSADPVQIGKRRTNYIYREINKKNFIFEFPLPEGASGNGKILLRLLAGDAANPTLIDQASIAIP